MKVKYLIIGAGVSGLSFATNVGDYLIVEKEEEPGGLCRTTKRNGYIWDYSGHFFHFQHSEIKSLFLDIIPDDEILMKERNTKIYFKDRWIDFPFQKNIHQLEQQDFIDALYDLYFREEKDTYDSFLDMLYGKFGRSITEMFLRPYNEKLYACDLNSLETDAMGRFFPYANLGDIVRNMKVQDNSSYNGSFLYPKDGAFRFIQVLLDKLDPKRVVLNTELKGVDFENKVAFFNDREIEYEYLINTIPFHNFVEMTGFQTKGELSSNKVLVFNLGFDKKSPIQDLHWVYFPEKKFNFYRVGFYDNILDQDRLSMYVEIGFDPSEKVDFEKELQHALNGLQEIGITEGLTLVDYERIVMDPAYVHISEKSEGTKLEIKKHLAENDVYSIGRYGDWKYCSIEDCVIDAWELAEKIRD